ncbi:MAG TPA: hypothetical protein VF753_22310 [Terriglobales bacterium]
MSHARWFTILLLLAFPATMHAQWVLAARAAKNQINRMSQHSATGGYDVATVVLDADPGKVYDKTIELLKTHPDVTITTNDKTAGKIEIQKGQEVLGFQIYSLGPKVAQMIVASGVGEPKKENPTPMVVESILRVCKQFNVECTVHH